MNIIVADDHELIGKGVLAFFGQHAPEFNVLCATNKSQVIFHLKEQPIDLIIQDVQFGNSDAREIISDFRALKKDLKIVALSSHADAFTVKSVLASGVDSYVSKTASLDELLKGVRATLNNEKFISSDIQNNLVNSFLEKDNSAVKIKLTNRELEVLNGIQDEQSTREIAESLHISEKTVEGYRSSLLMKFKVKNVAGLVKQAILQGYIK